MTVIQTCLPSWTRSIKPFYLSPGLHGGTWKWLRMFQNGGQASPRGVERFYLIIWLLAKWIKESLRFKILLCLDVEIVFFNSLSARTTFLSLWKLTYFNVTISHQDLTTSCTVNKVMLYWHWVYLRKIVNVLTVTSILTLSLTNLNFKIEHANISRGRRSQFFIIIEKKINKSPLQIDIGLN